MPTTIAIRFPLGRYHATRWDGGANTSDVEWPPSPWRLLRALLATRHTRWPDLDIGVTERLLGALGTPSAYLTPVVCAGSSRHYMRLVGHRTDSPGATSQVIDAFLALGRAERLLVQWSVDLSPEDRTTLRKLVELVPYLGRSESLCEMALLDEEKTVDQRWWRLGVVGAEVEQVQLLTPTTVSLAVLEQTTTAVRKARRTLPPKTATVVFGRSRVGAPPVIATIPVTPSTVRALRFELAGPVHLRARSAVLAADAMHGVIGKILTRSGIDPVVTAATMGLLPDGTIRRGPHRHLHILTVPTEPNHELGRPLPANAPTDTIVLWSPEGFRTDVAAAIIDGARSLFVRTHLEDELPTRAIIFAGAGELADVYPSLLGPEVKWISWMPYLPVRHRKKSQEDWDFIVDDVQREASRHGLPPVFVHPCHEEGAAGQIAQFRRRRNGQNAPLRRRGVYVRLEFTKTVTEPVVLGQLSHFGYGVFVPESG